MCKSIVSILVRHLTTLIKLISGKDYDQSVPSRRSLTTTTHSVETYPHVPLRRLDKASEDQSELRLGTPRADKALLDHVGTNDHVRSVHVRALAVRINQAV